MGYEEITPENIKLEEGVYYNKYMTGNKIRMASPLSEGVIEYTDGTKASQEQMAKDVVSFLTWAAEPHLEARKELGFKSVIYLLILPAPDNRYTMLLVAAHCDLPSGAPPLLKWCQNERTGEVKTIPKCRFSGFLNRS